MTKFTAPKMSVIRFNESDVIVASNGIGKTMTVSLVGNGTLGDATFTLGNGASLGSSAINGDSSSFSSLVNDYLGGTYFSDSSEIMLNRYAKDGVTIHNVGYSVLQASGYDLNRDTSFDSGYDRYNGVYTWNGSIFIRPYRR